MKILQIINSLRTGGAEKLVSESVPLFQAKGVNMDVLCLDSEDTPFKNKLKVHSSGQVFELSSRTVYNPLLILRIAPFLRGYDIIHVHLFPSLYWVAFAKLLTSSRVPIVYTEHNTNNKRRKHFLLKHVDKMVYLKIQKVITISKEVDSALRAFLPNRKPDTISMVQNGINLNEFIFECDSDNHAKLEESPPPFNLIQVSSFRQQKDQPTLIRSLQFLPSDIHLKLVGDGPLRSASEELVKELNLSKRVQFLGIRNDIADLLAEADVVVLSSNHEGLSLSSIEGMASKPFIASDVPGLRDIVDGYGILFKKGDPNNLAANIMKLYKDPDYYNIIKKQCRERAMDYDINKMIDSYIEVYREILSRRNK